MTRHTPVQSGVGYRMFDCAEFYENEHIIGPALQRSGVKREDLSVAVANEGGGGGYSGENLRARGPNGPDPTSLCPPPIGPKPCSFNR